ncbi:MAG: MarR family transcriptional regulator [SAR324 cluster bacterium]|jgi:DNA-binding MarR family transcriptional regulator|nr:MarR family transcriptional regulator [SAR324 cluster bacterium]|tara:strand:- start:617 stop:1102 length:486 start_codon:yes stop_codon:yes gene_type:complete
MENTKTVSAEKQLDTKQIIRLWLGLLKSTGEIERYLRTQLHKSFASTLPQFDLLSALDHAEKPLTKTELSNQMMVTNGNVTWLVNRMAREGLITHVLSAKDRRVKLVEMTEKGATFFQKMVAEHEKWLINIFKDLKYDELNMLVSLLNRLRKVTLKNIKAK